MIIVTGTARFGAGEVERLREALAKNVAATRAEAGCEQYSYAVDIDEPDLIHVSERWANEAAVEAHMAAPHMAELMQALGAAKVEALSIKAYEGRYVRTLLGG